MDKLCDICGSDDVVENYLCGRCLGLDENIEEFLYEDEEIPDVLDMIDGDDY